MSKSEYVGASRATKCRVSARGGLSAPSTVSRESSARIHKLHGQRIRLGVGRKAAGVTRVKATNGMRFSVYRRADLCDALRRKLKYAAPVLSAGSSAAPAPDRIRFEIRNAVRKY
ncbi:unnamed protein product, partial [Iphiclides podalirius]